MLLRVLILQCACLVGCAAAQPEAVWRSEAVERELSLRTTLPDTATTRPASVPAVVVLRHIDGATRTKPQAASRLLADGNALVEIDYAHDPKATAGALTKDLLKLRSDLKEKKLVLDPSIDINRLWILPEGFGLKRDVTFFKNEQKTWQLDIAYPLNAKEPVPTLMEITCDNASRMGNFSLVYCRDTLLEGGLLRGFAAVMIDHPVPPPYKGLDDPMPELIHRLKSAVRTVRSHQPELNLNGKIGALGFSRGGPMAAFLAVTNGRPEFDVEGEHQAVSSDVQAALVHGNRYDYSALQADDPMLARFEKAWGPFEANREKWLAHGVAFYLRDTAAPMYLSTSQTESPEYRQGLRQLHERLLERSIEHQYREDSDARGHTVSTDPASLEEIYRYLHVHLK